MEQVQTFTDPDAKVGHKNADSFFFGDKTQLAMSEEQIHPFNYYIIFQLYPDFSSNKDKFHPLTNQGWGAATCDCC